MAFPDRLARMREDRRQKLARELPRLVEGLRRLGAMRIILFGSAAAGNVGFMSDLDLMAVIPTDKKPLERLAWVYQELEPSCADILVYTPEEFDRAKESSSFVRHAVKIGKVIYEA